MYLLEIKGESLKCRTNRSQFPDFKYKQGRINHIPNMLSLDIALISLSSPDSYALRVEQLKDPLLHEIVMFPEERAVPQQRPPLCVL